MTEEEFYALQKENVKEFILQHLHENPHDLALKYSNNNSLPIRVIVEQIQCTQKAAFKLPGLNGKKLLFDSLALEQASGEITAKFKTTLIKGRRVIDLTGGLGIDSIFLSQVFEEVIYCEENAIRTKIFEYNSHQLKLKNLLIKNGNSIDILKSYSDNYFDWIYIDPSRRKEARRLLGIENYSPNILEHLDLFYSKAAWILIKLSPAEEPKEIIKKIPGVSHIYVISVNGECKEILLILDKKEVKQIRINAVVLESNGGTKIILENKLQQSLRTISSGLKNYFYEPDSAIIKAKLSIELAEKYQLLFINNSVDYLTSDQKTENFPGRIFQVKNWFYYNKRLLKQYLKNNNITAANISRRDFPDSPDKIKKNYNLNDGGNVYLFFTKGSLGKFVIIHCEKP